MSFHIYKGSGPPTITPTNLADHYVDELNGKHYNATGLTSSADWKLTEATTLGPELEAIKAAGGSAAGRVPYYTGPGTASVAVFTTAGRNLVAGIDVAAQKTTLGLNNVQNVDQTNPANITQSASYRFVTDTEKTTWNGKENAVPSGTAAQYYRGDKSWQTLDKAAVGLSNVPNTDATARANHTGTQLASTISDFSTAADARITAQKGVANGLCPLDGTTKIASTYLPSFVDDVLEYANLAAFPVTGESGKIYLAIDTNFSYRWTGSTYAHLDPSLALGETSTTAYRGDRGKIAYDHSQVTTGNPHGTTKTDLSLGNVDNTSDLNKPISTATQTALNAKEPTITGGTSGQVWTGIKTWVTLTASYISDFASAALAAIPDATTSVHGLMSAADKEKLNTISYWMDIVTTQDYTSTSSASWTSIDDWSSTLQAGVSYTFKAKLRYTTSSTNNGISGQMIGTAEGDFSFYATAPTNVGSATFRAWRTLNSAQTFPSAAFASPGVNILEISGFFDCTSTGSLNLQFRNENSGQTIVVKEKSLMEVRAV
jgi:hypothetical protein